MGNVELKERFAKLNNAHGKYKLSNWKIWQNETKIFEKS